MGTNVSRGQNNEELVDNLVNLRYLKTDEVIKVFRSVDRGDYVTADGRYIAYTDAAWRNDYLHLSAPCIYSYVMETLQVERGMSFLNVGSGTGYLSTMIGLLIGEYGINHGIELRKEAVQHAEICLDAFITQKLPLLKNASFCKPIFAVGNALLTLPNMLYDRIYCGARCPLSMVDFFKKYLKIDGCLILPIGNRLCRIERTTTVVYNHLAVTRVAFSALVMPKGKWAQENSKELLGQPLSLYELTRMKIRDLIQNEVFKNNPEFVETLQNSEQIRIMGSNRECLLRRLRTFDISSLMDVATSSDDDMSDYPIENPFLIRHDDYDVIMNRNARDDLMENEVNAMEHEEISNADSAENHMDNSENENNRPDNPEVPEALRSLGLHARRNLQQNNNALRRIGRRLNSQLRTGLEIINMIASNEQMDQSSERELNSRMSQLSERTDRIYRRTQRLTEVAESITQNLRSDIDQVVEDDIVENSEDSSLSNDTDNELQPVRIAGGSAELPEIRINTRKFMLPNLSKRLVASTLTQKYSTGKNSSTKTGNCSTTVTKESENDIEDSKSTPNDKNYSNKENSSNDVASSSLSFVKDIKKKMAGLQNTCDEINNSNKSSTNEQSDSTKNSSASNDKQIDLENSIMKKSENLSSDDNSKNCFGVSEANLAICLNIDEQVNKMYEEVDLQDSSSGSQDTGGDRIQKRASDDEISGKIKRVMYTSSQQDNNEGATNQNEGRNKNNSETSSVLANPNILDLLDTPLSSDSEFAPEPDMSLDSGTTESFNPSDSSDTSEDSSTSSLMSIDFAFPSNSEGVGDGGNDGANKTRQACDAALDKFRQKFNEVVDELPLPDSMQYAIKIRQIYRMSDD